MLRRICVMLVIIISGCELPNSPATVDGMGGSRPVNPIFATQLAGPDTYLAPMPTAVVILKPEDMARNRVFCAAVMKIPTVSEATAKSVVAPNIIFTRWLTQFGDVPAHRVRDCEFLVGAYDYQRAVKLMAPSGGNLGSFSGRGPFLAMIIPGNGGGRIVAVDGSRYNEVDFDRFVASWNVAVNSTQTRIQARPDAPGVARSVVDLVAAIFRTVFGATAGLILGAFNGV